MLKKIYMVLAVTSLLLYASAALLGWELSSPRRQKLPESVRQSPGGYRSFHFWHSGFSGGK